MQSLYNTWIYKCDVMNVYNDYINLHKYRSTVANYVYR